jgi:hypothetical protein
VDPEVAQTSQPYSYADDNPVNSRDPSGKAVFTWYCDNAPWWNTNPCVEYNKNETNEAAWFLYLGAGVTLVLSFVGGPVAAPFLWVLSGILWLVSGFVMNDQRQGRCFELGGNWGYSGGYCR